jgi:hypothetical protein
MRNAMTECKRRYLQIALVLIGGIFLLLYPLMQIWPSGWVWLPRQQEYEQMMIGVYATLGIFLIWASRRPEAHFSLIWFAFWSSLVHGIIMGAQAIMDPSERVHLMGDVAALFIAVVLMGWLTPRKRSPKTTDKEDFKAELKRPNS